MARLQSGEYVQTIKYSLKEIPIHKSLLQPKHFYALTFHLQAPIMLKVSFRSRRKYFALLQCIRSKLLLIAQELYRCHLHQHLHPAFIAFSLISCTHNLQLIYRLKLCFTLITNLEWVGSGWTLSGLSKYFIN